MTTSAICDTGTGAAAPAAVPHAVLLPSTTTAMAQSESLAFPTAEQSDPVRLGWMVGSPPPPDKLMSREDGTSSAFPQRRWALSNARQFGATTNVSRGSMAPSSLPRAERDDLDGVRFTALGKTESTTWGQAYDANYTDGIVVLHRGRIVYERYSGVFGSAGQHLAMSVTKSFFGTLGAMLVAEGRLDENATVAKYVPELNDSAFGDATVRQLLDMRTGLNYSENYADPNAGIWAHGRAGNVIRRTADYAGPKTFYEYLQTVTKEGDHGGPFAYKTVNTDALGWVIRRVTGKSVGENLSDRIWSRIGAEQDAYFTVDSVGNEFAGGGLNTGLRDLARFGELMRNDGRFDGQQIVPKAVVDAIRHGGDRAAFRAANYVTLPGWSYRDMWWVSHNPDGAFMARGIYGQALYIDPRAEMVIARYASHPLAANADIDPYSLPAYDALARHLIADPR